MQASQQDRPAGQDMDLAGHGFETQCELADQAALVAKGKVSRAILKQAGQTKTAAAMGADLGRDQQTAL